jgi:uncharacterized membrane protein YjgN (DUF898 family)
LLILLFSILLDRLCISRIAPWLSGLIGLNPIPVIFGVPVNLPITLGLIPILVTFVIFYSILIYPYRHSHESLAREQMKQRMSRVFVGILSIPLCTILSGIVYLMIHDHLSRALRNGIESFGLNADIYLFYPTNEITHLKGGVVILTGFLIGIYIFIKKTRNLSPVSNQTEWYIRHTNDQDMHPQHLAPENTV